MRMSETILEQIQADTRQAMKAGERDRVAALRMLVDALQKDRKEGGDDEVAVLRRERKRRRESESVYRENGRDDLADTEADQAAEIETYLPAELSDAELETVAGGIIPIITALFCAFVAGAIND